jgi:hypothetical protein
MKCRLAQRADVITRERGRSQHGGPRGAGRADANTRVAMMLALKRCPRCGHYDHAVAKHNRYNLRFTTISSAAILAIVALLLFAIPAVPPLAFAVTTGALAIGFLMLFRMLQQRFPVSSERFVHLRETVSTTTHDAWY